MTTKIALAGNPNSGKTTLFNSLTGSNQYVGNWPGVTVERKSGHYIENQNIEIMDLPGIYSLSPYSLEEIVSRDYLITEHSDVIINVVDASNLERNLYLTTQLKELGIPIVVALNMMDVVKKRGDAIDTQALARDLHVEIVEISALRDENIDRLMAVVEQVVNSRKKQPIDSIFPADVEQVISEIEDMPTLRDNPYKRWYAVKLIEEDRKIDLSITADEYDQMEKMVEVLKVNYDDDGEGLITDGRYRYIENLIKPHYQRHREKEDMTAKIDKVVTNRFLALPIFVLLMFGVYYIAISLVGGPVTDWFNEVFLGEMIGESVRGFLEEAGTTPWLVSLLVDGIIGGVGAVIGFLPIIITLEFFIALLEDVGYMSRIAFILDKIFRHFGLSGKSFIPILVSTGCAVPGVLATRTIEDDRDRRMTIMLAPFMPCGAKVNIIALFSGAFAAWYFAPIAFFAGIAAIFLSGLILKKTAPFAGDPAPFIMELPDYHLPRPKNIFRVVWDRVRSFLLRAGSLILLATVIVWLLQNISIHGEFHEFDGASQSILEAIGRAVAPIFMPLGFGDWMATVSSFLGLMAKEAVVGTYGVVAGLGTDLTEKSVNLLDFVAHNFTLLSAFTFMLFNQLTVPCFAVVGAVKGEMKSTKWTLFALGYQILFSYFICLMIYQFGLFFSTGNFTLLTGLALLILFLFLYLILRKDPHRKKEYAHQFATE